MISFTTIIAASGPLLCAATPVPKQHCAPKHYEIRIDMSKMQLKLVNLQNLFKN